MKRRILLIEACQSPHVSDDKLIIESHVLSGMSMKRVIEENKKRKSNAIQSGVATTALYSIPMGLAYIASGLSLDKYDVFHIPLILDAYKFSLDKDVFLEEVKSFKPDLVGISLNHTADRFVAINMCQSIKKISRDIFTVLGGVEASFSGKSIIENSSVDFIIEGEGDQRFAQLVDSIFEKKDIDQIKGILHKHTDKVIYTGREESFVDISNGFPSYDLFSPQEYINSGIFAQVQTSRGCPFACSFCSHTTFWGKCMRYRNIEPVVREVNYFSQKGADVLFFTDSTFVMEENRCIELLNTIKSKIQETPVLVFETRVDSITPKVCEALKDSGVGIVAVGVESGDSDVLQKTGGKGFNDYLDRVLRVNDMLKNIGIEMYAPFIIGLPGESEKSFSNTKKLILSLHENDLLWADVRFAMAFPGAELTNNPEKYGVELLNSSSYLFYDMPGFISKDGLTKEELVDMHRELITINMECVYKKPYFSNKKDDIQTIIKNTTDKLEMKKEMNWFEYKFEI